MKPILLLALLTLVSCVSQTGTTNNQANGGITADEEIVSAPATATDQEKGVFTSVNEQRANGGLNALQWSSGLYNLASAHGNDMCDRTYFSHYNPENEDHYARAQAGHAGNYTFAAMAPAPYNTVGENLAQGPTDSTTVMNGWMNSVTHRNNILDTDYTHTAIAYVTCSAWADGALWVEIFGKR
ncbi:MAG: CAP domain-containing protein [Pseudomonadota bacterium]